MRYLFFVIVIFYIIPTPAQVKLSHRWKKIAKNSDKQFWYDIPHSDSLAGNKFDVWLLQVYNPPLRSEGIKGNIFLSKTLYSVDLNSIRYGILKLRYYDNKNLELYKFDYANPPSLTDESRYPYPILEESPIYLVVKTLFDKDNRSNR